jgi:hypothetical protein
MVEICDSIADKSVDIAALVFYNMKFLQLIQASTSRAPPYTLG